MTHTPPRPRARTQQAQALLRCALRHRVPLAAGATPPAAGDAGVAHKAHYARAVAAFLTRYADDLEAALALRLRHGPLTS